MAALTYKVIKSKVQYNNYCDIFEELVASKQKSRETREEIELLAVLIDKYDEEILVSLDPVQLLLTLMEEREMKAKDLVGILRISKGLISDILNYRKGLSKKVIRILSDHFQVSQEAFNRPYRLKSALNSKKRIG
jgi:HTH-type transcriptional regulator/antitoxin HigA